MIDISVDNDHLDLSLTINGYNIYDETFSPDSLQNDIGSLGFNIE